MRKGKAMKKIYIILVLTVLLLGSFHNTYAQIFIMEEDECFNDRIGYTEFDFPGLLPDHDTTWDYTPIGDGLLLLGCLGGAYLLGKRRKKDDK